MIELLTSAQMKAIEQAAIDSGSFSGLELMERAGAGVVEAVHVEWPNWAGSHRRAAVLCGPGNNGGDGFVVARLLSECGWKVEVVLYGDPEKLPADARANFERWQSMGSSMPWPGPNDSFDPWCYNLIVDALFGTGLSRPISFDDAVFTKLPEWDLRVEPGCPKIVAIDLPSGLCSDSGRHLEHSGGLWADLTVTFHRAKVGHFLGQGARLSGKVAVHDIGLQGPYPFAEAIKLVETPASIEKHSFHHKFDHGHALILAGGSGKGGAARLSARGALRIGAGLVTVGAPSAAIVENAAQLEAIMLREVTDASDLTTALADPRITALCLGPGLGLDERARGLVVAALDGYGIPTEGPGSGKSSASRASSRPMVLDADALTFVSENPDLFASLHENCVLTPHAGEFARLFPDIAEKLNAPGENGPAYSKVDATREAAARAGCVVLFKGPDTVIADPSGRCAINSAQYDRAAPWLATAGSGDVLSGFITGLLARGFAPMAAAETAAWLHVECALRFGPGLIAEDLPEELPSVFEKLLGNRLS